MALISFSQISSHMKQKRGERKAKRRSSYPTHGAEPLSSKEGWEAGITEKKTDRPERKRKKGASFCYILDPSSLALPLRMLRPGGTPTPCTSQFLLRRQIDTQRNQARKAKRTQDFEWAGHGGKEASPRMLREFWTRMQTPQHIPYEKGNRVRMLGDLVLSCPKPRVQVKAQLLETVSTSAQQTQLRSQN